MRRFFIVMDDGFDIKPLRDKLNEKKIGCMFIIGHNIVITGEARYGDFCSVLWYCQKYGPVRCELAPV